MNHQRLSLLQQIDALENKHCKVCVDKKCNSCKINEQLRDLGEHLLNETNNRRAFKEIKEIQKQQQKEVKNPVLTVEVYKELKADGMSDRTVMEKFGMNNATFYDWKDENGLVQKYKQKQKKVAEKPKVEKPKVEIVQETISKRELEELNYLRAENQILKGDIERLKTQRASLLTLAEAYIQVLKGE